MRSAHRKAVLGKILVYILLLIIAIIMITPFLWMFSAAIKSDREVFKMNPFVFIPKVPKWSNYLDIWTRIPFAKFVENTVFLTVVVTILQLLTSSFAAYSFAKLRFRYRNGLFLAYIATIAMPWQVYMVPQFILMRRIGLNDKLLAIICLQAFSAFGVFLMKQFYESIPDDLCEAARIDGCTDYGCFFRIMVPNMIPAYGAMTILSCMNSWNNLLWPLIVLNTNEKFTIPIGMGTTITPYGNAFDVLMPGAVMAVVPIIIVYLFAQKTFIAGLTSGSVKG